MRIWDAHCHITGGSLAGDKTPESRGDHLVAVADRMGVERMCICMGMSFLQDPTEDQLRQQNDAILNVIDRHPDRFFGYVYTSPKHVEVSLQEMERCLANGPMIGVKLWVAQRCNAEDIDPIIRRATELKAVVLQHTWFKVSGNYPGESTPTDFVEMVKRHPKTSFICGHTGGDWEQGIPSIRDLPNVVADIAGSDPVAGFTEMAVREMGDDRVVYGSDIAGRSFASQLAKVYGAEISDESKEKIFQKNLHRLFQPIFEIKGIRI